MCVYFFFFHIIYYIYHDLLVSLETAVLHVFSRKTLDVCLPIPEHFVVLCWLLLHAVISHPNQGSKAVKTLLCVLYCDLLGGRHTCAIHSVYFLEGEGGGGRRLQLCVEPPPAACRVLVEQSCCYVLVMKPLFRRLVNRCVRRYLSPCLLTTMDTNHPHLRIILPTHTHTHTHGRLWMKKKNILWEN